MERFNGSCVPKCPGESSRDPALGVCTGVFHTDFNDAICEGRSDLRTALHHRWGPRLLGGASICRQTVQQDGGLAPLL